MTHNAGDQSYFPRARCRLIVRFEDYGAADTPSVPELPPQNRRGSGKDPGQALVVVEDAGRLVLTEPGTRPSSTQGGPQDQDRSDDGRTHVIEGVIPIAATWQLNGVRQADTLSLTIQYKDFPFDPRAIRSLAVKFFLGCVTSDDAERGARGEVRSNATVGGDALPFDTVPDSFVDSQGRTRSNLRFEGWVDQGKITLDDAGGTAQFECTDNTCLLIDATAPPRLTVSGKQPIDKAIAEYLAAFPQFRGLSVEYRPATTDANKPVLGKVLAPTSIPKAGEGPTPGQSTKLTVYDYLTDVCGMVGHLLRIEGTNLVIQRARTLFGGQYSRPEDPFRGREVSGQGAPPLTLSTRMYAYGINVRSLDIERGWRKRETTNVECRCYSTSRKKTLIVRFPEKGDRVKSLKPGQAADQKWEVIRVRGIDDLKTLKLVAQNFYESRNRGEIGVIIQTPNLGSFGGDDLDPDALDVREGDPIRVEVVRRPGDTDHNTLADLARGEESSIRALGFPDAIAAAYARAREGLVFPTIFRLRTATFDWVQDTGVAIKMELINYVEVRVDAELPPGEEPSPPDAQNPEPERVSVDLEAG